jgi:hypothetical protein
VNLARPYVSRAARILKARGLWIVVNSSKQFFAFDYFDSYRM